MTATWDDAHLVNAIVDIHRDDPEFGYRFIADELERAGHEVCEGRCATTLPGAHGSGRRPPRRGRARAAKIHGPAVHDDLVSRDFRPRSPTRCG